MTRRRDWIRQLSDYMSERLSRPFAWGTNDCISFAAGAVEAMTGQNYKKDFPSYSTALEARRIIKQYGGLDKIIDHVFDRIPILMAQRGDLALMPISRHGPVTGVVMGSVIWAPGETGIVFVPIHTAVTAWRV